MGIMDQRSQLLNNIPLIPELITTISSTDSMTNQSIYNLNFVCFDGLELTGF